MQDPRVRFACAFLLSLAAFISLAGAAAVFFWWLVFTPRWKSIRHPRAVLATLLLFVIIAAVITLTGTGGTLVSCPDECDPAGWYLGICRFPAWDFLAMGTWLLGPRIGFEPGMIAEMAMGMAQDLSEDFSRIRLAMVQKGQPWGISRILPAGRILICDALRRAEESAEILAMRGYRGGGTVCTRFSPCLS